MIAGYGKLAESLRRTTGIVLPPDKDYVVTWRLEQVARRHGYCDVSAFVDRVLAGSDASLFADVVDALTTNETFFFRDRTPFRLFATVILPQLLEARARERHLRIWCTACSTGQEPYSLAMGIDQFGPDLAGWRIDLHATDLSHAAIATAQAGRYNQFEAQRGMPANYLLRYFERDNEHWRVVDSLRSRVQFAQFNLLRDFSARGAYDVVFCRNVLIYFDAATRNDVLRRLAQVTKPDGFLVLGATEAITGADAGWAANGSHPMLYQRKAVEPAIASMA